MDILVTKRLTLRAPLEVDAEAIAEGLSNFNVSRMLARVPHPYTMDHARSYVAEKVENPELCLFTIHRNRLIGSMGVQDREQGPTLGFWLAEPYWGKGYASEAARTVLAYAFCHYETDIILSYAFEENEASLRILDNMGFERTGTGTAHCTARGGDLPHVKTAIARRDFERRFGPLETARAA